MIGKYYLFKKSRPRLKVSVTVKEENVIKVVGATSTSRDRDFLV